jgi:hypothetical protein
MSKKTKLPADWNEERVKTVLKHYEEQSEDEALAEDEAAFGDEPHTVIEVPTDLLPTIRQLIAKHKKEHGKTAH